LFDWIASQSSLDANKVMVTGGSYGGFMMLAVATNYNDRICCSLDVVGPSNLVTFLEPHFWLPPGLGPRRVGRRARPENASVPREHRAL
jgi:hypothetical protein